MANENKLRTSDVNEPLMEGNDEKSQINQQQQRGNGASNLHKPKSNMEKKRIKSVAIIEDENEKKSNNKWKLVPPDGGWGWLVLLGSTLVNFLIPGTVKSFGVLFVEFLETFEASSAAAAWIPALCYFLYSSLGPVSSILSVKTSYRTVTIIGGTFGAVGMILSYFANSVTYLCISYGLMVGTGAGLSFPPTVYIVTSYFVRLRGLANGICISGSALGSIILPPLLRLLLATYGYRGSILIMGAVTLHVWVAALFYDPVGKHMKKIKITDETEELKPKFVISIEDSMTSLPHFPHNDSFIENMDITTTTNNFNRSASSAAVPNIQKHQHYRERKISVPVGRSNDIHHNNLQSTTIQNKLLTRRNRIPKKSPSTSSFQYITTPYHGSTLTLQPETFASSFSLRSLRKTDDDKETENKLNFFDLSLLKDPVYLIILISNATNAISYTNFIILLPSYALSLGFDKDIGAILLSIVSIFDLIGRIGGSALSDLQLCPKVAYFIGGLLISGISLVVMPFFPEYIITCICCSLFGLASGIYVGTTAVVMADMLGEERLQSTYGVSLFVNGICQLIGPPICGIWYESTREYVSLFCVLGIILIIGAAIWVFIPFINNKNTNNDNGDEDDDDEHDNV